MVSHHRFLFATTFGIMTTMLSHASQAADTEASAAWHEFLSQRAGVHAQDNANELVGWDFVNRCRIYREKIIAQTGQKPDCIVVPFYSARDRIGEITEGLPSDPVTEKVIPLRALRNLAPKELSNNDGLTALPETTSPKILDTNRYLPKDAFARRVLSATANDHFGAGIMPDAPEGNGLGNNARALGHIGLTSALAKPDVGDSSAISLAGSTPVVHDEKFVGPGTGAPRESWLKELGNLKQTVPPDNALVKVPRPDRPAPKAVFGRAEVTAGLTKIDDQDLNYWQKGAVHIGPTPPPATSSIADSAAWMSGRISFARHPNEQAKPRSLDSLASAISLPPKAEETSHFSITGCAGKKPELIASSAGSAYVGSNLMDQAAARLAVKGVTGSATIADAAAPRVVAIASSAPWRVGLALVAVAAGTVATYRFFYCD
jgi:hypothetical protein